MVSYPDDGSSNTTASMRSYRSPSSILTSGSSRTSVSQGTVRRQHRHARSYAGSGSGGGSLPQQNEFPLFLQTGDVEIILKNEKKERRYVLHRLILAQNSGFFESSMSEDWVQGAQIRPLRTPNSSMSGAQGCSDVKRWRYELDWRDGSHALPMLVKKPPTSASFTNDYASKPPPMRGKPPASANVFFKSMSNFTTLNLPQHGQSLQDPDDGAFQTYDNMFRIFYNFAPVLDSVHIAEAYVQCKSLLQLADMYDATDVVGQRVDHHLLHFHARLWKQIAKYPASYLKLGYLARSKAIFQEAIVHIVGQWPAGRNQLQGQVTGAVMEMIEDKVDELEDIKARVEAKLWRLTLTTSRGDRVTPYNSWLDWQMMSLWRQWFAENTTPQPVSILKPPGSSSSSSHQRGGSLRDVRSTVSARATSHSTALPSLRDMQQQQAQSQPQHQLNTGRIFRLIGSSGSAYLGHEEVKRFLKISAELYSRETVRRGERRLDELKNLAKDAVKPLMRNFLQLEVRENGLPYLACTQMYERDWQLVFGDD